MKRNEEVKINGEIWYAQAVRNGQVTVEKRDSNGKRIDWQVIKLKEYNKLEKNA